MNTFELLIGDPSGDGHGISETYIINTNAPTLEDVWDSYSAGVVLFGLDLVGQCCVEYQDSNIPEEVLMPLIEIHGFDYPGIKIYDGLVQMDPDFFTNLFVFICQLGNPSLEINIIYPERLNIGGYGLFDY